MNAIARTNLTDDGLGWSPSIERLQQDYELALNTGRADPWALVEAECWLDLVEAELSAKATQEQPGLRMQLVEWRRQLSSLVVGLRRLASDASTTRTRDFSDAIVNRSAGEVTRNASTSMA